VRRCSPLLGAALLAAACAPAELSAAGASVLVASAPPAGCARLSAVQASAGYNGRGAEANAAGVEASLRNDAAARGGDVLVIRERGRGAAPVDPSTPRAVQSGGCPACVSMTADVYRCGRASAPDVAEAALAAAAEAARRCWPEGRAPAPATLRVTFAPSGDVIYAEAEGEGVSGTPVAACVADKLRHAHVPPFTGAPRSLSVAATLRAP
jgi:hypothetical protein